ncbi:hypothetical protein Psal159_03241 (plasmid) [Piscirickettsia salmonis]|nr:hypothetical protein Psal107_03244 [Piscirickettsia salmonis]QGP27450.1 hypothetical protein Psal159_03241 [Piscirickettsia salmonis]QGP34298.1 hypothetical protein Psal161_03330 [Piscirickettsia salmonis]QGP37705.1 hypothetical protein Psal163_03255 [Piscirickettsia salmonis]
MTCKLSSTAEHFHDDFNHRARNIIAIGHIVAPPSSASLEKMFKRELNQTNYLIVLINKRLIIQTTINYTTALLKSRAVLSEPILAVRADSPFCLALKLNEIKTVAHDHELVFFKIVRCTFIKAIDFNNRIRHLFNNTQR